MFPPTNSPAEVEEQVRPTHPPTHPPLAHSTSFQPPPLPPPTHPPTHPIKKQLHTLLHHLVLPRALLSPEDAMYTATFFHLLHTLQPPHFASLHFFDLVLRGAAPLVFAATDQEALNLGTSHPPTFFFLFFLLLIFHL